MKNAGKKAGAAAQNIGEHLSKAGQVLDNLKGHLERPEVQTAAALMAGMLK